MKKKRETADVRGESLAGDWFFACRVFNHRVDLD